MCRGLLQAAISVSPRTSWAEAGGSLLETAVMFSVLGTARIVGDFIILGTARMALVIMRVLPGCLAFPFYLVSCQKCV